MSHLEALAIVALDVGKAIMFFFPISAFYFLSTLEYIERDLEAESFLSAMIMIIVLTGLAVYIWMCVQCWGAF